MAGGFFTDKQGRVRPIRGGKAGGAGVTVAAGAVALAVLSSGAGGTIGAGGAAAAGEAGVSSSAQLRVRKAEGKQSARKGDAEGAWQRFGLRQVKRTARQQGDCLLASHGQVRDFFTTHRCTALDRVLFAVADAEGRTAVVSVAWVGLASTGQAREFTALVDEHGTGDITPLGAGLLELADVEFTGLRYGSERSGKEVTIAEVENAGAGGFDHETLDALAEVAAHLPKV
ncbi:MULTISPECIES: hypothetical protein [Actinosynnema]|uniref:hypothetical protein n=1 Tax=Actinosynnema TaxID=40566 RepID=UPI0020A4019B|nr:hypothetical protein [Actinosynnema pretiosum]MCP2096233.1 hypothetical protein [Actinosynnema pretiosum]